MADYSMVTTGDSEEDQRQMDAFLLRTYRMSQNICLNGCGPMNWIDAHNRNCLKCGFAGFSTTPFDMEGGTV